MKKVNNQLNFSISDIVRYFKSPYASWATWANLVNPGHVFVENDMVQNSSLLARSEENENSAKSFLINKYSQVKTINNPLNEIEKSKTLIKDKVEVIVQPSFKRDQFIGRADFLIFDKDQNLFEVMDAKLAKQVKPEFLLQVCGYSWMLASDEYQGDLPKYGWFYLGDGKNVNFKLSEYYKFFIDLKEEFLEAVNNYSLDTIPIPKKWENFEEFSESADKYWKDNKKLELIADISSRQIEILEKNGYTKIDQIPKIKEQSFSKLSSETLDKIKRQANAQLISTDTDTHVELRNEEESIHQLHSLLPEEQPGDIYFDLEGYPFADITSEYTMEYLYGVVYKDENGKLCFKDDLWADNDAEEKIIFSKFVKWVEERIKKYPNLRIYHYAHYEKTSLVKSAQKFGIHEIEIDKWLIEGRLVDLYQVVRKSFIIGKDSYSLKRIEEVAGYTRELDLNSGIDSIYYFERYLNSNDLSLKNKLKDEILMYNKDDCLATEVVCNWLRNQKKNYPYNFTVPEIEEDIPKESDLELLELETKINNLQIKKYDKEILEYVSTISGYYRREERVRYQEYFRLKNLPLDDKINDSSSFGLLSLLRQPELLEGKYLLTYECHDDTFKKLKLGDEIVLFLNTSIFEEKELTGNIIEIYSSPFSFKISISENYLKEILDVEGNLVLNNPTGIIQPYPRNFRSVANNSKKRLINICNYLIENKELPLLVENILKNKPQKILIDSNLNDLDSKRIFNIAKKLENAHLTIQGPPGTGKSTIMGEVIYKLFKEGKKIGIAAPSYFSALNLVKKVVPHLSEEEKVLFYHTSSSQDLIDALESTPKIEIQKSAMSKTKRENFNVIASYTHKFAQEIFENHFDYLVIDEVGQVPMATTLSLCHATKNLLLIGDHNQLPQVINGSHPNKNSLSTMEYLIDGDETVSKDKGLFLGTTFRMHKDVNKFISKYFYDDLLRNHDITNSRTLNHSRTEIQPTGIQFIPVHHTGNTQSSIEEVEKVEEIINELLNSTVSIEGEERKLSEDDVLIVSPYNSQVYELRKKLGEKFRVGTVDKFQGQEAPVVIVSLTASNYEEAPRGIDFILNFNRINVALSRSQCLSIVVGSPELTHLHNQSLNSIRLTNLHRTIMNPN
tara:strand:- start:5974 stop:9357 length:3384 start_codon:yes stop_codon:yes gene_type:complete